MFDYTFDYTVITDFDSEAIDYNFLSAFVWVGLWGYEPEFRFIYEEGEYPQMVWITWGVWARVHGRYINIDDVEYFDPDDLSGIPNLSE
ncbi:MAG: hypothetical protein ACKPFF_07530 [Planktothrix sp.]